MTTDSKGNTVFRIVSLDRQTEPHIANMKDDYSFLEDATLMEKRSNIYQEWVEEKMQVTYIRISDRFKTCNFATKGWLN